jgi:hypothetical protein
MTAAKSGDSFSNAIPRPLAPEPRAGDPHRHLSPCSEVSKRVARLGGRLDLSQLDISRGFTAFSSGSSWRLVTISCEPVTKYENLLAKKEKRIGFATLPVVSAFWKPTAKW